MKKIYKLITLFSFALFAVNANAATIPVAVGVDGSGNPATMFTPSAITCNVGDVVEFVLGNGTHNVTSTSVPGGAAAMSSGTMSTLGQMYNYTVTVAGAYAFHCTFHAGMNGTINASTAAGIAEVSVDLLTSVYPNPFNDRITLKYGSQIGSIRIFNVLGEQVKLADLSATEDQKEIDFEGMPSGIYFIRTYKGETVIETKKVVKVK
ncbi:MAG: T9SS type A sorting domain-containing protein [Bacteroidia bacterium]